MNRLIALLLLTIAANAYGGITNVFTGTVAGDGTGDSARVAFSKLNTNDTWLAQCDTEASNHWQTVTSGLQGQLDALVPGTNSGPSLETVTNIANARAAVAVSTYAPTNGPTLYSPTVYSPQFFGTLTATNVNFADGAMQNTGEDFDFTGDVDISGTLTASTIIGIGGGITGLNASALTGGTVPTNVLTGHLTNWCNIPTNSAPFAWQSYHATNSDSATTAASAVTASMADWAAQATHATNADTVASVPPSALATGASNYMVLRMGSEVMEWALLNPDIIFQGLGIAAPTSAGVVFYDGEQYNVGTINDGYIDPATHNAYSLRGVVKPGTGGVTIGTNTVGNVEEYTVNVPAAAAFYTADFSFTTTNSTTTNCYTRAIAANKGEAWKIFVTGYPAAGGTISRYELSSAGIRLGAGLTVDPKHTEMEISGTDINTAPDVVADSNNMVLQVTGAASATWTWHVRVRVDAQSL